MADQSNSDDSESSSVDDMSDAAKRTSKKATQQTPPRKKVKIRTKQYTQKFKQSWLEEEKFKKWLSKSRKSTSSKDLAYCSVCNVDITCGKSEIVRHSKSQRHLRLSRQSNDLQSLTHFVISNSPLEKRARMIELHLCSFLAEHYLPISLSDPLLALLRKLFPESEPLKKVSFGKQRTSNIIRQVFGQCFSEELCIKLREKPFSVIIDETTDRSTSKQLSIMVQFYDKSLVCVFLDLLEVKDSTAVGIFTAVKECFINKRIPMDNIIGFCSDTASVMMGSKHSVSTLLKKEVPNVVVVKCACHMMHLTASNACLKLPKYIEDLCRNIYSHFSLSSKRQDTFKEFQIFASVQPHKILSPGQTRWLSLQMCVKRLLEQWSALKLYFTELAFSDPTHVNDSIVEGLQNEFSLAYLEFLDYNLGRFNSFNTQFQSESPNFHLLKRETHNLIKRLCSDFMKPAFVRTAGISELSPQSASFHQQIVPLHDIYLGISATETIGKIKQQVNSVEVNKFYQSCRNFLVEAVAQIQERYDFKNPIYELLQCTDPANAVNLIPRSLSKLLEALPQISKCVDIQCVEDEWRSHYMINGLSGDMDCMDYWNKVFTQKNAADIPCFPNLEVVITSMLALPFSNAAVERFFSKLNLTKTSQRSCLKNETICGLMHAIYHLKVNNASSHTMQITDNILKAAEQVKSNATCSECTTQRLEKEASSTSKT